MSARHRNEKLANALADNQRLKLEIDGLILGIERRDAELERLRGVYSGMLALRAEVARLRAACEDLRQERDALRECIEGLRAALGKDGG